VKNTRILGLAAEELAFKYLLQFGLELITRNYRCYFGEIDLILNDHNDLVFTEVRSRNRIDYGHPSETITKPKQRRLISTAIHFLQKTDRLYKVSSRFDIVAIHYQNNDTQIEWIKNAFTIDN
jgi:putative endonuclease